MKHLVEAWRGCSKEWASFLLMVLCGAAIWAVSALFNW